MLNFLSLKGFLSSLLLKYPFDEMIETVDSNCFKSSGKNEKLSILSPVVSPTPFIMFIGLRNPKSGTWSMTPISSLT